MNTTTCCTKRRPPASEAPAAITESAAEIRKARDVEITFVEGSGGVLDVALDGQLIFSKKQVGRWPEVSELLAKIPATA